MIPCMSPEMLTASVEMVCYFFTALGVALTFFMAGR